MIISQRSSTIEDAYRYGFNGQEKVDEISGAGNHYTAPYWEYDPRILRRWNQDPKPNPSISNYVVFAGNPIWFSDPLGDTIRFDSGSAEEEVFLGYREKVFGSDKYTDIQKEILDMESSTIDFRLRTGGNVSSEKGSGNTRYNKGTGEIDLNFGSKGDFSDIQTLSHELKHGHQYLEGKLGFKYKTGNADGILNDYQDEYEAYKRQNRFSGPGGRGLLSNDRVHQIIRTQYGYDFRTTNRSLKTISSGKVEEMIRVNKLYMEHAGHPNFIYNDYESDLNKK